MTQYNAFSSIENLKQAIQDEIAEQPKIKVNVLGPNLWTNGPETFHVHAHGCSDIAKNYGPGKKLRGDDRGWVISVSSRQEIVEDIYCEHMDENGDTGPEDWKLYDDLRIFPCVKGLQ